MKKKVLIVATPHPSITSRITLENISDTPVTFKTKGTADIFHVLPKIGFIPVKNTTAFRLKVKKGSEDDLKGNKVVLLVNEWPGEIGLEPTYEEMNMFWKGPDKDNIAQMLTLKPRIEANDGEGDHRKVDFGEVTTYQETHDSDTTDTYSSNFKNMPPAGIVQRRMTELRNNSNNVMQSDDSSQGSLVNSSPENSNFDIKVRDDSEIRQMRIDSHSGTLERHPTEPDLATHSSVTKAQDKNVSDSSSRSGMIEGGPSEVSGNSGRFETRQSFESGHSNMEVERRPSFLSTDSEAIVIEEQNQSDEEVYQDYEAPISYENAEYMPASKMDESEKQAVEEKIKEQHQPNLDMTGPPITDISGDFLGATTSKDESIENISTEKHLPNIESETEKLVEVVNIKDSEYQTDKIPSDVALDSDLRQQNNEDTDFLGAPIRERKSSWTMQDGAWIRTESADKNDTQSTVPTIDIQQPDNNTQTLKDALADAIEETRHLGVPHQDMTHVKATIESLEDKPNRKASLEPTITHSHIPKHDIAGRNIPPSPSESLSKQNMVPGRNSFPTPNETLPRMVRPKAPKNHPSRRHTLAVGSRIPVGEYRTTSPASNDNATMVNQSRKVSLPNGQLPAAHKPARRHTGGESYLQKFQRRNSGSKLPVPKVEKLEPSKRSKDQVKKPSPTDSPNKNNSSDSDNASLIKRASDTTLRIINNAQGVLKDTARKLKVSNMINIASKDKTPLDTSKLSPEELRVADLLTRTQSLMHKQMVLMVLHSGFLIMFTAVFSMLFYEAYQDTPAEPEPVMNDIFMQFWSLLIPGFEYIANDHCCK